jgi:hypothetical protein
MKIMLSHNYNLIMLKQAFYFSRGRGCNGYRIVHTAAQFC